MTKSGWVSAGILGTILWGCLSWQGWMSVVIYLLFGSLVTKIGFKFKKAQGLLKKEAGEEVLRMYGAQQLPDYFLPL